MGIIREEVWQAGMAGLRNTIWPLSTTGSATRTMGGYWGYDNAHGEHERHFKGAASRYEFTSYEALVERFIEEVRALREVSLREVSLREV
jgi:hypothetical protein